MTISHTTSVNIRQAIDEIEEAYEFMLAYAAQGRQQETETEGASQIRRFLERFRAALNTLSETTSELSPDGTGKAFIGRFADDTEVIKSVLDLLINQDTIASDMIDNTNGLIAVRAFLTDLFFIDQVLLPAR